MVKIVGFTVVNERCETLNVTERRRGAFRRSSMVLTKRNLVFLPLLDTHQDDSGQRYEISARFKAEINALPSPDITGVKRVKFNL